MAVKPGTPHPTKKGMVMGKNGSYVSKTTYAKQVKAAKAATSAPSKPQVQRALPAAGQSGGSKPPKGTKQPGTTRGTVVDRRSAAASKRAGASVGSRSTGVRVGQPAKAGVGARVRAAAGKVVKGAKGSGVAKRVLGRAAVPLGIAAEIGKMSERAKRDKERNEKLGRRPFEELRGGNRSTAKSGQGNRGRNRPTPTKRPVANLPADYKKTEAEAFKKAEKSRPARQNSSGPSSRPAAAKPKPKPKAKPQTSGVGPVASGRTYSVKKTGKSVMQQQADELRAMRKASQERQAADKKKLEASKKKRKYNR